MNIDQTTTVRISIGGKIVNQLTLDKPATLAEVWKLPEIIKLGPYRMARLGQDGIAYVSAEPALLKAWRMITEPQHAA